MSQQRDWKSGLFSCFDGGCGTCLYGCCCPGCAAATARNNYDGSNWCFNCTCVGLVGNYNIVREGKGIEGGCLGDVLTTVCCTPCAAVRLLQETEGASRDNWKKAGNNRWSHGLLDMCAAGACTFCMSCFCSACVSAQARTNFDSSNCCFNLCCLTPVANYNIIREGSGIEGGCVGDCFKGCCCAPCAAIQLTAQVPH